MENRFPAFSQPLAFVVTILMALMLGCSRPTPKEDQEVLLRRAQGAIDSAARLVQVGEIEKAVAVLSNVRAMATPGISHRINNTYHSTLSQIAFGIGEYDVQLDVSLDYLAADVVRTKADIAATSLAIAHCLKKSGDLRLALTWYARTLPLSVPNGRRDVHNNLAQMYLALGHADSALYHLDRARIVAMENWKADVNGHVWDLLMRARCMWEQKNATSASRYLDSAGMLLHQHPQTGSIVEYSVRRSIVDGFLRDAKDEGMPPIPWMRFSANAEKIIYDDKHRQQERVITSGESGVRSVRHLLGLPGVAPRRRTPTAVDATDITGQAVDSHGWHWVSTLTGLCVRMGNVLVPIEDPDLSRQCRAIAGLQIQNDTLILTRYSGKRERRPISSLVPGIDKVPERLNVAAQWKFTPWTRMVPSALSPTRTSDDVIWWCGTSAGFGTRTKEPSKLHALTTEGGRPLTDSVRCAVVLSDTSAVIGTQHGLWVCDTRTWRAQHLTTNPSFVDYDDIGHIAAYADTALVVYPLYNVPSTFSLIQSPSVTLTSGKKVHYESGYPWSAEDGQQLKTLLQTTLVIEDSVPLRNEHKGVMYPDYSPFLVPHGSKWLVAPFRNIVQVFDRETGITERFMAPEEHPIHLRKRPQLCAFGDTLGFVTSGGLVTVAFDTARVRKARSLYAIRLEHERAFRLYVDGDRVDIEEGTRRFEHVIGVPAVFGNDVRPVTVENTWSDSTLYSSIGALNVLAPSEPGVHSLKITTTGDPKVDVLIVDVVPMYYETLWFRLGAFGVALLLIIVGIRYRILTRRLREQDQERAVLRERLAIGQDLHDAVGADLVRINQLARRLDADSVGGEISMAVAEASRSLRDIIWFAANQQTLDAAIAVLIERTRQRTEEAGLRFALVMPSDAPQTPITASMARDIVMIATEAVTNIFKHANAGIVTVSVEQHGDDLVVRMADDGIGLPKMLSKNDPTSGRGMVNMRSRAERSGLGLKIASGNERGSFVELTIPMHLS